jgi:RNA polymerase sigma-70 factor (TIGR02960 family)
VSDLLERARGGDEHAFAALVERHRRELAVHCYRMLGSMDDADDALQETLVAAWRALSGFEGRSSLRTWLYTIATNVSLRMAERRRRLLSWDRGAARDPMGDLGLPVADDGWLEPWIEDDADPAELYSRRETIELAYVAALQHLPANQRAVLILRDVLGFSAAETADVLDTSEGSVTSALQRARITVTERVRADSPHRRRPVHDAAIARMVQRTPRRRCVLRTPLAAHAVAGRAAPRGERPAGTSGRPATRRTVATGGADGAELLGWTD